MVQWNSNEVVPVDRFGRATLLSSGARRLVAGSRNSPLITDLRSVRNDAESVPSPVLIGGDVLLVEPVPEAMQVSGGLSLGEIESFLENVTIPARIACRRPDERLWMLSLWFRFQDGSLHCATSKQADVVEYLEHDSHVAFEVSTNDPPYRGVRGNGTASVADDPEKQLLRELLERYLGSTDGPLARKLLSGKRTEVTIAIDPSRVYGWDFSDRMQAND